MLRRDSLVLTIVVLALVFTPLLISAAGRPEWGDPSKRVWYRGQLVPFGELLRRGVEPQCHDGLGPGIITCYDTKEELAAATGVDLAGVDQAIVEELRASGAVAQVRGSWYACVWDGVGLTGRSFLLSSDYSNFREILFDNITSSIQIPAGAGYSSYFAGPQYGPPSMAFNATEPDLRIFGFDNMISSARKGSY
jgi:hypothetical protein